MSEKEVNNNKINKIETKACLKRSFLERGCSRPPDTNQKLDGIYQPHCCKYDIHDWLKDIRLPEAREPFDIVEVRFKNSRKDYFKYNTDYDINIGDIVAVESNPGHDIGIVSLTGEAVKHQLKRKRINPKSDDFKRIYRKARINDIEKWIKAVEKEEEAKFMTRDITQDLKLDMKINDVEYQGDGTKAIFYYTADERVDFRELIKILADKFKIRIEMRQIGARQEASRLGGIGSCGRELCCSTWICDFRSVTINTARKQQLTPNPQKLAGQCGKLKCCLNYEHDSYTDALKKFPHSEIILKTKKGDAAFQKSDVYKKLMWYSYLKDEADQMAIPIDKVKEIIEMNKNGKLPEKLEDFAFSKEQRINFENAVDTENLERFDKNFKQ